jgi:putative Mn2+ efflux pump MntP
VEKIFMNTTIALIGVILLVVGVVLGIIVPIVGVARDLPSLHPFVVGVVSIVAGAIVTAIGVRMKKKNVPQEEKKKQANLDERDHT